MGLQLGKWMDTSGRVMDKWGEISMVGEKAKKALGFTTCHFGFLPPSFLELIVIVIVNL